MKVKLELPLSAKEISDAIGGTYKGDNRPIKYVCTDTRELDRDGVFFALGKGEKYTCDALKKGLAVSSADQSCILVRDTSEALLSLAGYYKKKLTNLQKTVAITGSVGKTCVKDYTAAILKQKYKTHKTSGNFNNEIGLPLTILSAPADTEALVLEIGMNHAGEIRRMSIVAKPDIAVITNIGLSHIGNLGSKEITALAKREIFEGMKESGIVVIPADEPLLSDISSAETVGKNGKFSLIDFRESMGRMSFRVTTPIGKTEEIELPWNGIHFADNLVTAVCIAIACGLNLSHVNKAFLDKSLFIQRQKYINVADLIFYDDSYNASPESFRADFKILDFHNGTKSAVIGDIWELGKGAEEIHRCLGASAAKHTLDRIYPFGEFSSVVSEGARSYGFPEDRIFENKDTSDHMKTAALICENSSSGELILIKGSHALHTEKIIDCVKLLKKV